MANVALREITPTHVVLRGIGHDRVWSMPADTVVLVGYHEPNREIADHLTGGPFRVQLIGDVNGTNSIQAAIHAAAAVARQL